MVYTLSTQLREMIADMFVKRKERTAAEDEERYRREEEASLSSSTNPSLLETHRLT